MISCLHLSNAQMPWRRQSVGDVSVIRIFPKNSNAYSCLVGNLIAASAILKLFLRESHAMNLHPDSYGRSTQLPRLAIQYP